MKDESVKFENIYFSYGSHPVLKNVSLSVKKGETVCVLGPNGAGKSTLMLIAMGLLQPQKGKVRINGKPVREWPSSDFAKYCAYVPQRSHLPPALTVWESVMLGRTPHLGFLGIAGRHDEEIVERSIAEMEIENISHRRVGEISGGERQRVILARMLAQEPSCLFLDEPTHSLDMHHQATLLSFIRRLTEEKGVTALCVVHDLNLASTFSDKVILLADGELAAHGTPEQVINNENIVSAYGNGITIFPRPDESGRPAALPVRTNKKY
jgi:iron complex transport system ATP-binding protein